MSKMKRDIMAPDNEPTDEDLAIVMREARDEALRRHEIAERTLRNDIQQKLADGLVKRSQWLLRAAKWQSP